MHMPFQLRRAGACALTGGWLLLLTNLAAPLSVKAQDASWTNLVAEGEFHEKEGDTPAALKSYQEADRLSPDNADILCRLAKQYCDSIRLAKTKAEKKDLAQKALDCGLRAVKAAPQSPKAHCCLAVCYAKNFPYSDNQTKVDYSRQIKAEAEKAIEIDPKFDLAYHMLGRWNFEVSNMNFFVKSMVKIAYGGLPKASKKQAIDNFKQAVELMPNRIINHLQLARLYHVTDQETMVAPELQQCAALTPIDMDDKDGQDLAKKILAGAKWPEDF